MVRVLIVDDEAKLAEVLQAFLVRRGFAVWTASTGDEALALLQTHQPEILLLDLHLAGSGLQGLDVLRTTKAVSPHTTVIVTSACPDADIQAEVLRLGARCYLEKPLSLRELLSAVNEVTTSSAPSSWRSSWPSYR